MLPITDPDPREPFLAQGPWPARHDEAQGAAMDEGQGLAVHRPDQQGMLLQGLGDRYATRHGLPLMTSVLVRVGAEMAREQCRLFQARLAQNVTQRDTRPFCAADAAMSPGIAFRLGLG